MKTDIFLQKTSNLFVENRLLKFVIIVLALTVIFNSLMVYRAVKYQRVVLIPPTMTGTVEFVQGKPTDDLHQGYEQEDCQSGSHLFPTDSQDPI